MRTIGIALLLVLACASSADAEPRPFRWAAHRPIADRASDILVALQLAAEIRESWQQPDRWHALGCDAVRTAIFLAITEATKRAVHRTRPDGSDEQSFWSGHTGMTTVNGGRGWRVLIPINVGLLRMGADKHYMTDVAIGAAVGWLVQRACAS